MNYAEWLQGQMGKYHLTNYRLAKIAGVHQSAVRNILDGKEPHDDTQKKIKAALASLDADNEKDPAGQMPSEAELDAQLISRLCSLTPEELAKVDAFVEGLIAAR